MTRFAGQAVIVTGASGGIGAAIARRFAREGASVVLAANEQAVEAVAASICAEGGEATPFVLDVTSRVEVVALYDAAEAAFGRVDISVQNAGIITIARIEAMTVSTGSEAGLWLAFGAGAWRIMLHRGGELGGDRAWRGHGSGVGRA